jgi:hypothetical protein
MATHTLFSSPAILSHRVPRQIRLSSSVTQIAIIGGTQLQRTREHGLKLRCLAEKSQVELPHDGPHAPASFENAEDPGLNSRVEESNGTNPCSAFWLISELIPQCKDILHYLFYYF